MDTPDKLLNFKPRSGPLLIIVADGVGVAPAGPANAVALAKTPVLDELARSKLHTTLCAHGTAVGLPSDADMGNSEVGHNTIGGGRVFAQGAKLVNDSIQSGALYATDSWQRVSACATEHTVHFLGLLSDGNVHSHIDHLLAMLDRCAEQQFPRVRVHILLDGRDVSPRTCMGYIDQLNTHLAELNEQLSAIHGDYRIASGGGRMHMTMDRYEADWAMVERGYQAHVHGVGEAVTDINAFIEAQYANNEKLTDQDIVGFVIHDSDGPVGKMADGDALVMFNFRGDRAMEISRAMDEADFKEFDRGSHPNVFYCGMLQYDGDLHIPANYLVDPPQISETLTDYTCALGLRSFAISETQKYGHVTYFWNGNRSEMVDPNLETYVEIPSNNLPFNTDPDMQAREITRLTIETMRSDHYDFGRINLANGDMVGHTGDLDATIRAMETVDECIGELIKVVNELGGITIVTADHGNADEMFTEKNGVRTPRTSHTLNPVPFTIVDSQFQGEYALADIAQAGLANIAATALNLLGYARPIHYEPSLIEIYGEPRTRHEIFKGSVVDLNYETSKLPNGEVLTLEIVRHPGGATMMALNDDNEVCLIRQFRHSAGGWIWEFPAGTLEADEPAIDTAKRELIEEAGITAEHWTDLGFTYSTPGFCTEKLYLFLAQQISVGKSQPEEYECIEIHWKSIAEIQRMINDHEINDAKTIVLFSRALAYLNPTN